MAAAGGDSTSPEPLDEEEYQAICREYEGLKTEFLNEGHGRTDRKILRFAPVIGEPIRGANFAGPQRLLTTDGRLASIAKDPCLSGFQSRMGSYRFAAPVWQQPPQVIQPCGPPANNYRPFDPSDPPGLVWEQPWSPVHSPEWTSQTEIARRRRRLPSRPYAPRRRPRRPALPPRSRISGRRSAAVYSERECGTIADEPEIEEQPLIYGPMEIVPIASGIIAPQPPNEFRGKSWRREQEEAYDRYFASHNQPWIGEGDQCNRGGIRTPPNRRPETGQLGSPHYPSPVTPELSISPLDWESEPAWRQVCDASPTYPLLGEQVKYPSPRGPPPYEDTSTRGQSPCDLMRLEGYTPPPRQLTCEEDEADYLRGMVPPQSRPHYASPASPLATMIPSTPPAVTCESSLLDLVSHVPSLASSLVGPPGARPFIPMRTPPPTPPPPPPPRIPNWMSTTGGPFFNINTRTAAELRACPPRRSPSPRQRRAPPRASPTARFRSYPHLCLRDGRPMFTTRTAAELRACPPRRSPSPRQQRALSQASPTTRFQSYPHLCKGDAPATYDPPLFPRWRTYLPPPQGAPCPQTMQPSPGRRTPQLRQRRLPLPGSCPASPIARQHPDLCRAQRPAPCAPPSNTAAMNQRCLDELIRENRIKRRRRDAEMKKITALRRAFLSGNKVKINSRFPLVPRVYKNRSARAACP